MLATGKLSLVLVLFTIECLAVNLAYSARYKGLEGKMALNGYNAGSITYDEAAFIRSNCEAWGYNCSPTPRNPLTVKVPTIGDNKPASSAPLDAMRKKANDELEAFKRQRDAANNGGGTNSAPEKRANLALAKGGVRPSFLLRS